MLPRRRWLLWLAVAYGTALFVIVCAVLWVFSTQSGARWVIHRAARQATGELHINDVRGSLVGRLELSGIGYRDAGRGVEARVAHASLHVALRELLSRRVRLSLLDLRGIDVRLFERERTAHEKGGEEISGGRSLAPPIDMFLDRITLHDARIRRDGGELIAFRSVSGVGRWTHAQGLVVEQLIIESRAGSVHLEGSVDASGSGRASGSFHVLSGDRVFSGDVAAIRNERQLTLHARMGAPFRAQLDAAIREEGEWPWTFSLSIPSFDPREQLQAGNAFTGFAATLDGEGTLATATARGGVTLNGQQVHIERFRVKQEQRRLHVEELRLLGPWGRGTLTATGAVRLGAAAAKSEAQGAALFVDLVARWHDVELPEQWIGQPIATRGMLSVVGTSATFAMNGEIEAGPPGHPSDIALDIAGTPEQIEVRALRIEEHSGSLSITGALRREPSEGWRLSARARHFDPGRFVAEWPGKLTFSLDTSGRMATQGLAGSLALVDLAGTLRGRTVGGHGALTLRDQVIAGQLNLRVGKTELRLEGRDGRAMDLDAEIDIASLGDWLSRSAGRITGRLHVGGTLQRLAITGSTEIREFTLDDYSARSMKLIAQVRDLQRAAGTVSVTASDIGVGALAFSTGYVEISGEAADHGLQLDLTGKPLSLTLRAHGTHEKASWSGSVDRLGLAYAGFDTLTLRKPTRIYWSPERFSVSESCLAGDASSACVAATRNEKRELDLRYRLAHLPIGPLIALALPGGSLHIEGAVDGEGALRRTADGALHGTAQISSEYGRIFDTGTVSHDEGAHTVLMFERLKAAAQFAGHSAHASVESRLAPGGKLSCRITLQNLDSAPLIAGDANVVMPDLAPAGWFVPQLAELHGSGEGHLSFEGPLRHPHVDGRVVLRNVAAEVPAAGIQLEDAELDASMSRDAGIAVNAKVRSGEGEIRVSSAGHPNGRFEVQVHGQDFVALDIPLAALTLAPDLTIVHSDEGTSLTGALTLRRSRLDLAKLPTLQSGARVSPDVVVVDEEPATREAPPTLSAADLRIVLADEVRVFGRGLEAEASGQLRVRARDGHATTASGDIYLNGTYHSVGPDFAIDQGRVRFDGGEITNPQVDFTATRNTGPVMVTLNVTGRVQNPLVEVTSDPPMSETQALAYLMVGRPLTQLTSGDGAMVEAATRALGSAAGNALAAAIGARLGISNLRIEEHEDIGSSLTIGQYLSPRLYLSYSAGLFEAGHAATLRFRLTNHISIKAKQGPRSQKAGISWRIER